jgi:hypothetical protein
MTIDVTTMKVCVGHPCKGARVKTPWEKLPCYSGPNKHVEAIGRGACNILTAMALSSSLAVGMIGPLGCPQTLPVTVNLKYLGLFVSKQGS